MIVKKTSSPDIAKQPSSARLRAAKSRVERKDGRQLRRFTIYLDVALAREILVYCASNEMDISELFANAIVEHMGIDPLSPHK
jgi:hypothetical protein